MRALRITAFMGIILLLILSLACPKNKEESRTITVIMKNLGTEAVHIFLEGQMINENNLIPAGESGTTSFLAKSLGHKVSFYVARDEVVIYTTNCAVSQSSWDSRQAEVDWTGKALLCASW